MATVLMIWPLKLSPPIPALWRHSLPKTFKTVSIWRFVFQKTGPFSPDFGVSCRLLAIFRPKKITGCNCGCNSTLWTLEQSFKLNFFKSNFMFSKFSFVMWQQSPLGFYFYFYFKILVLVIFRFFPIFFLATVVKKKHFLLFLFEFLGILGFGQAVKISSKKKSLESSTTYKRKFWLLPRT